MKCKILDQVHQLASYWAAIVHDYEHEGLSNDFLVKTQHHLAVTYNDQSPLENHHLAASARVVSQPQYSYMPVRCLY